MTVAMVGLLLLLLLPSSQASSSSCTQLVVGHHNEERDNAVLLFSDFNKMQSMVEWSQHSCINLRVHWPFTDPADVLVNFESIPKMKELVTIISSRNAPKEDIACSGFAVDWVKEGEIGAKVSLCPGSVRNLHINISYYGFFPYCVPNYSIEDGSSRYLLDELEARLGFVIDNRFPSRGYSRWIDGEGKVQGLVGEVSVGLSELGFGQPGIDWNRFQHIDFLPVIDRHRFGFCSARPRSVSPFFTLTRPFPWTVWLAIIIVLLLMPTILSYQDRLFEVKAERRFQNISLVFSMMVSATGQSENIRIPKFIMSRLTLITVWFVVGTFLCIAYSSELLASLVKLDETQPLDTIDEMYNSGLPVSVLNQSITSTLMKTSSNPKIRHLFQTRVVEQNGFVPNHLWDSPELIRKEQEGKIITVSDWPATVIKDTHFASQELLTVPNGNIIRKGSSFNQPVARVTEHLLAGGLVQKKTSNLIDAKILKHKRKREKNKESWNSLRLHHYTGLLVVFTSLLFLATLCFGMEITEGKPQRAVMIGCHDLYSKIIYTWILINESE